MAAMTKIITMNSCQAASATPRVAANVVPAQSNGKPHTPQGSPTLRPTSSTPSIVAASGVYTTQPPSANTAIASLNPSRAAELEGEARLKLYTFDESTRLGEGSSPLVLALALECCITSITHSLTRSVDVRSYRSLRHCLSSRSSA